MERLDNYAIAFCLYFLNGNTLSLSTVPSDALSDDLHDYFDLLRANLGVKLPALFQIQRYNGYCDVFVNSSRFDELKKSLTEYTNLLIEDKLDSSRNVLAWKNKLKAFIDKAKSSGYNLQSYNVTVKDIHVVLYGLMLEVFELKHIDIIPDEVVSSFYNRDTSGDVEGGDVTDFYKQLEVHCTVDIETFISKQNKKNVNSSSAFTAQEDWLYKYICDKTGHASCSIPMQLELIDPDQSEPNTFPNFKSFKQAYHRLNKRYESKYGVKPFVKKVKNEDLFRITFAKNDKGGNLL